MATSIEELKEFLTADEIAAYEAEDEEAADDATSDDEQQTGDDDDATDEDGDDEDQDEGEEEGDDDGEEGDDDTSEDDDEADKDPVPAEEEAASGEKAEDKAPLPDVKELDEQLTGFKDQRKAIIAEYDDGDIDSDELQAKLDALDEQADAVKIQRAQAQQEIDSDKNQWLSDARAYFKQNPGLVADQKVLQAYDSAVRYITSSPAFAHLTNQQVLARAHAQVAFDAEHLGLDNVPEVPGAKKEKKPNPEPAKDKKPKPKPKKEESDIGGVPKTLSGLPSSDMSGTDDSPFASLQRLADTPGKEQEFEAALQKLSPEQREAFSSADY